MKIKDKVLIVEDEQSISNFISMILTANGFDTIIVRTGEEALTMIASHCPDMIVLDLGLPDMDGMTILRSVREWSKVPILVVSARSHERDKVEALDAGADDYITKPFVISEVIARVRAVLRRSRVTRRAQESATDTHTDANNYESDVAFKGLRIDRNAKTCYLDGEPVSLTKTEFSILLFFLTHPNRIYTREEIIRQVWSNDVVVSNRTIDTNITRLRKKIGSYGNNIVTRLGFGYGFKEKD